MGLLDGKLAELVAKGLKGAKLDKAATLIVVTSGTRMPGAIASGTNPTTSSVTCRGLVVQWKRALLNATTVQVGDRVVMLLGATLSGSVPKVGDKITIEGSTTRVIDIERDPASATYSCLTRA